MVHMTEEFQSRDALGNHLDIPEKHEIITERKRRQKKAEKYAPYIDYNADLPTILEAHQFLMKKFVIDPRERKHRMDKAKNVSSAMGAFYENIIAEDDKKRRKRSKQIQKLCEIKHARTAQYSTTCMHGASARNGMGPPRMCCVHAQTM